MLRVAVILDPAAHLAGLRRGMTFVGCAAAICAALAAGAGAGSAKAGHVTAPAKAGQP